MPVALLLTDVVMPQVDGHRLAEEARRCRPGLKVLFTTGYSAAAAQRNDATDPQSPLLGKPYTLAELGGKLRQVLRG